METTIDYARLQEAYTSDNLTKISAQILKRYHDQQFGCLRELAVAVGETDITGNRQLLVRLMLLYHPDRLPQYLQILEEGKQAPERLSEIGHLLIALNFTALFDDDKASATAADPDLPEETYAWEMPGDVHLQEGETDEDDNYFGEDDHSFYNLFKRSIYGRSDILLPAAMLEDIDELELSGRGMDSLEGIEHCRHLVTLDLSGNVLTNLDGMEGLAYLEELYLADNMIGYIDAVTYLSCLKVLDLSGNQVDDVLPLLTLPALRFVNLIGNPVPQHQLNLLKAVEGLVILF